MGKGNIKCFLFIVSFSLILIPTLIADDFFTFGGRSLGMGGTGVASTRGVKNVYWNPARLTEDKKIDISLNALNLNVEVKGTIIKLVDEFNELPPFSELQEAYENGFNPKNPTQVENTRLAFKILFDDVIDARGEDGIVIHNTSGFGGHFNVRNNAFAVSGFVNATVGVSALIDIDYSKITLSNGEGVTNSLDEVFPNPIHTFEDISVGNRAAAIKIADILLTSNAVSSSTDIKSLQEMLYQVDQAGVDLTDPAVESAVTKVVTTTQPVQVGQAGSGQTFEDALKKSGFWIRGLLLQTATITYARSIHEKFSAGVNLNLYKGRAFRRFVTLDDIETYEIPTSYGDLNEEDFQDSYNFGVDIGLSYQPFSGLSLGLTGKNLNRPEFDYRADGSYKLYQQARFGISYSKDFKVMKFSIAADVDLFENKMDAFPAEKYQQVGLGVELNLLKFLFLRGGYNNNIAAANGKGGMYTAGVGFYVFGLSLDISAGMGDDQVKIEGNRFPTRGGLAFELQWNRNF
jgi:hypothetical protein